MIQQLTKCEVKENLQALISHVSKGISRVLKVSIMASALNTSCSASVESANFIQRKSKYNALSQVLAGVIVEEGIFDYIDYKIEDLGSLAIHSQLDLFCDKDKKIRPEYNILEKKKLYNVVYFLEDFIEDHIRIILSRVHGDKMYLERTHDITLQAIHVVTGFCNIGDVPALRMVSKIEMSKLTSMIVNSIKNDLVKYACMVIGYQTLSASKINSISAAMVNVTYRMIKEDASFDLCTDMQRQLLLNLKSIKQDNALRFKFGQLLVGLFFYFQGYFLGVGEIQWSADQPVTEQIKESLQAV